MICLRNLQLVRSNYNILNSLSPVRCGRNFKSTIFKLIIQNSSFGTHCEIALKWMPQNLTSNMATLVQVMVWCHQATSHYLSQFWPKSLSPYDLTRPQWVKEGKWLGQIKNFEDDKLKTLNMPIFIQIYNKKLQSCTKILIPKLSCNIIQILSKAMVIWARYLSPMVICCVYSIFFSKTRNKNTYSWLHRVQASLFQINNSSVDLCIFT